MPGVMTGTSTRQRCSGAYVSDMNADQILSGLKIVVPLLPLDRYLELFPMREVLEGHLAGLAAAKATEEEAAGLCDLAEELRATASFDEAQKLDQEFHSRIIRAGGDPMMGALLEAVRRRGQDYRILELEGGHGVAIKHISDQAHIKIAGAIRDREPEVAKFLMMQHIRSTKDWLEGLRPGPTAA